MFDFLDPIQALLAPHLAHAWQLRPHLVMEGLALQAARVTG